MVARRAFLRTAAGASAAGLGWWAHGEEAPITRFRAWDVHCHLYSVPGDSPEARMEVLIRCADRLGIERMIVSQGYSSALHPTPQQIREENDRVMRAVRRFPDRAFGSVFLSPLHPEFSIAEFDRCVRDGPMIGVGELEADKRCNCPEMDAIVERAISLNAPIIQHTWMKLDGNEPGESTPADLVALARRHPRATFICAHTGGNWELGIRVLRSTPNILAECAGFDPVSGMIELAVRELGPERVVYGSDVGGRSFASQAAKVLGASISDASRQMIFGGNLRRCYADAIRAKGLTA